MKKPISTRVHGVLDYVTTPVLFALPRILGWNRDATRLLTGSAIASAIYTIFTNYELGLIKVLPFKGHLALDTAQTLALGAAPAFFAGRDKKIAAWLLGLAVYEGLVILTSQTEPEA